MLLITIFVELRVVAGRSRTRAGSPQVVSRRPCCAVALRRTAWSEHGIGMASVNQTRPHCVNQMGKTHSKPLAARHGRGTAWARHAMCESVLRRGSAAACLLRLRVRMPPGAWMSVVSIVCCQVQVSATGRSVFQRSPTERVYVCVCARVRACH
jgi:hypothetical protein